jgi:hypothetical protein
MTVPLTSTDDEWLLHLAIDLFGSGICWIAENGAWLVNVSVAAVGMGKRLFDVTLIIELQLLYYVVAYRASPSGRCQYVELGTPGIRKPDSYMRNRPRSKDMGRANQFFCGISVDGQSTTHRRTKGRVVCRICTSSLGPKTGDWVCRRVRRCFVDFGCVMKSIRFQIQIKSFSWFLPCIEQLCPDL